jgi:hypothetical protein
MGTDDTIQIRCPRCQAKFRDKARRVLSGYSRQCPSCERMLFFEEGSPVKDIQNAIRAAERARKALRHQEEEEFAARAAASAQAAKQVEEAEAERVTTYARRGFDRRGPSAGRSRG